VAAAGELKPEGANDDDEVGRCVGVDIDDLGHGKGDVAEVLSYKLADGVSPGPSLAEHS
jgi:hypothetical protein